MEELQLWLKRELLLWQGNGRNENNGFVRVNGKLRVLLKFSK